MNSMQLPLVVIFFMIYFIGLGGMATSAPLDPLLEHILLTPKYLDQFLMVLHATFTTGMHSFDQNIGLLPLVSVVS